MVKKKNNKMDYSKVKVKDNMNIESEEVEEATSRKSLDSLLETKPKKVKRGLISRLVTGVLGPEGLPGIGSYVAEEIIVPAIKSIIVDAVTSGVNMVMYGSNNTHHRPRAGAPPPPYARNVGVGYSRPPVNYASRYANAQPAVEERTAHRPFRQHIEEYIIESRDDAAHVLTTLTEQADMYGSVSVADYYDLIGVPSLYTDNNYGWTLEYMKHASIRPTRGGFIIKFPEADVI